jgi:hypothetical protein
LPRSAYLVKHDSKVPDDGALIDELTASLLLVDWSGRDTVDGFLQPVARQKPWRVSTAISALPDKDNTQ